MSDATFDKLCEAARLCLSHYYIMRDIVEYKPCKVHILCELFPLRRGPN